MVALQSWRFIPLTSGSGPEHMAIDYWLFEQHSLGKLPSCLRFYTWQPLTLSLGYHQRRWPADWQQLQWQGEQLAIARRPSGGRAVLHQGDLTYAVITTAPGSNRRAAYQHICQFLIKAWQQLGVQLNYGQAGRSYQRQANCFEVATAADLVTTDGFKFIGSAQLWRGQHVLQHGSIRLRPDAKLFEQVFGTPLEQSPTLELTASLDLGDIQATLIQAAAKCLQAAFQTESLSTAEWAAIQAQDFSRFEVIQGESGDRLQL